jgi:maleylacetate reductase
MPFFQYHAIDRVHFDRPASEAILEEASARNARRVFVVASRTLNRSTDAVRGCITPLGPRVVGIFDECVPFIPRETVLALAERLREARADLVVTIALSATLRRSGVPMTVRKKGARVAIKRMSSQGMRRVTPARKLVSTRSPIHPARSAIAPSPLGAKLAAPVRPVVAVVDKG